MGLYCSGVSCHHLVAVTRTHCGSHLSNTDDTSHKVLTRPHDLLYYPLKGSDSDHGTTDGTCCNLFVLEHKQITQTQGFEPRKKDETVCV